MLTTQQYYSDPYLTEIETEVLSVAPQEKLVNVILQKTIFYPEGGGQPSDRGTIGETKVEYVRQINGEVIHQVTGSIREGEVVRLKLDWGWRYKHMKIHSAGHLIHDVLMTMVPNITPKKGGHGKKAYLEYQGIIDPALKDKIEQKVNDAAHEGLEIITKEVSYDDLAHECKYLPENLPRNKQLRMIKIGSYPAMPDGGVQVKNTSELGKIWIANITILHGVTNIRYGVVGN